MRIIYYNEIVFDRTAAEPNVAGQRRYIYTYIIYKTKKERITGIIALLAKIHVKIKVILSLLGVRKHFFLKISTGNLLMFTIVNNARRTRNIKEDVIIAVRNENTR